MPDALVRLSTALADRYRIARELGQGGMATVYLAQDLKHDRRVAIKVLHPELAAVLGGERFLSEIRTTANLQHPHILGLIDSGEADGFLYYVMPFVEGETLRQRLERERQLPVKDAVRIATEVAGALEYAHKRGVIHRDVKPENILLQDGQAMVADFGIALAVSEAGGHRLTQTGLSLGTPSYMSPEQAMGERTITARSDVYALGALTYEMLQGDPPFSGSTTQAIIAQVMTARPRSLREFRPNIPVPVERAVLTALEKLPADRQPSAGEFARALSAEGAAPAEPTRMLPAAVSGAGSSQRRTRTAAWAVGLLIAGVAAGWWLAHRTRGRALAWSGFSQLTDASGVETAPSLAPDGESFAYSSNARGNWDIYVQRVGGRNPVVIAGDPTVDEVWPAYSPDGKRIAYSLRDGGIFVMGATGESARRLTTFGSNPAWSPDGKRVAFGSEEVVSPYNTSNFGTLWTADTEGGEPRQLDSLANGDAYQPAWSPSGARIAFWTSTNGQRDLVTIPAGGGARVKATDDVAVDWGPSWSPDGRYLYFASDRGGAMGIWRITVDEHTGRALGAPEPVASGVDAAMDLPHLSRDGRSLIFRSRLEAVNPAAIVFDPASGRAGAVTMLQHRTGILVPTDVSPDGKWLALFNARERQQDIFIMHPDGNGLTRLTDDAARDFFPHFTPDGEAVAFFSNQSGKYEAWSIRLDGSGRTRLTDLTSPAYFPVFSPDGQRLSVSTVPSGAVVGGPPWPMTDRTVTPLAGLEVGGGSLQASSWSRDGRWLAGGINMPSGELRGNALYEVATGRTRQLSDDARSYYLAWLPGGGSVAYFNRQGKLFVQGIGSLARREVGVTLPHSPDDFGSLAVSPDGRTLYYGAQQVEANIWMVEQPAPGGAP